MGRIKLTYGIERVIMNEQISQAVIRRLPRYYRYLGDLLSQGVERISSNELSVKMNSTASQIRQDLNNFGGFGQQAAQVFATMGYESNCRFVNISLPDDYIEHGDVQSLYEKYGLSVSAMTQKIVEEMKKQ